jgi:hypothetical protein
MKKSLKTIAATLAVTTSLVALVSGASAAGHPLLQAKQKMKVTKVSNHEMQFNIDQKKIDVKEIKTGNYLVTEEQNDQIKDSIKLTVLPATKNGVKGYDVTMVDLNSNQTVLHSFSDKDVFKLDGSQLNKKITGPDAIVYAIVTGNYWGLGAAATAILNKMESLGWFQVVSELYAEGESIWAIAGLLVSALPELGIALTFGTAF